jgi:DNA-binding transcriptional LysR family regulator
VDLESLRIFTVVASELSITRAAARLNRAPSNVTTRIQQLENDIGVELFVRFGKRMILSTAGERFLEYGDRMLALEEEARHVVRGGVDGGVLRIGSMESTAASRLPAILASYHTNFPTTRIKLETGPSRSLLERVRTGKLDCAFAALAGTQNDEATLEEQGLSMRAMWDEELQLLLPGSETDVYSPSQVRLRSLAAFSQGCTYRAIAEETLGVIGNTEWYIQEMSSYHAMIACVAAGACVTLLPKSVLDLSGQLQNLKAISVGSVTTALFYRTSYDVPAFQNLLHQIERS